MMHETEDAKRTRFWPTSRSKLLEFIFGFLPGWIALVGISIALLLPLIQSCRDVAH